MKLKIKGIKIEGKIRNLLSEDELLKLWNSINKKELPVRRMFSSEVIVIGKKFLSHDKMI